MTTVVEPIDAADDADRRHMLEAIDEARAADGHGDVPIGAVVVRDGAVIARRHNEREIGRAHV